MGTPGKAARTSARGRLAKGYAVQNIHPLFVHFPIALLILAGVLDAIAVVRRDESLHRAAWFTLFFGVLAMIATVVTGLRAEDTVAHGGAAHELMERHEFYAFTLLGVAVAALLLRPKPAKGRRWMIGTVVAEIALLWPLVVATGYYGGEMVYGHGVGTALTADAPGSADGEHDDDDNHGQDGHDHAH